MEVMEPEGIWKQFKWNSVSYIRLFHIYSSLIINKAFYTCSWFLCLFCSSSWCPTILPFTRRHCKTSCFIKTLWYSNGYKVHGAGKMFWGSNPFSCNICVYVCCFGTFLKCSVRDLVFQNIWTRFPSMSCFVTLR